MVPVKADQGKAGNSPWPVAVADPPPTRGIMKELTFTGDSLEFDCDGLGSVFFETTGVWNTLVRLQRQRLDGTWANQTFWNITNGSFATVFGSGINTEGVLEVSGIRRLRFITLSAVTGSLVISVSGGAAAGGSLQYLRDIIGLMSEDTSLTSGDSGIAVLTVRNDALSVVGLAGTDLDYQMQQSTPQGDTRVRQGEMVVITGTLTRPANVTGYTTNDELTDTSGNILTLAGCARFNAGSGYIETITVINDQNEATAANLDIFIFDTTSTPAADNAAFAPTDAVLKTVVAAKNLGTKFSGDTAAGGNCVFQLSGLHIPFVCGAASTSLFVRFAVRNAFTANANSSTFTVRLGIIQN